MRYRVLCASVLVLGLAFVPLAAAQSQSDQPAITNPPRYGDTAPSDRPYPQAVPPARQPATTYQALPPELVLPSGTLVMVRLTDPLSSDHNRVGDEFTAVLDQPLVAQGWVVARRGQTVVGRVAVAQKAGRVQGVSQLGVELSELTVVDGRQIPVQSEMVQSSAGTSKARDAAGVGTTTGLGAAIGAAAGGGEGAAIGAAAGVVAGIAGVLSTRGRATELYPETVLTFRLQNPVTVETQQAQQAFRPVSQTDYSGASANRNAPRMYRPVEAYPPPYYYYPPYPYYGYGYYGYGPSFFWGPRVIIGGRGFYRHRH